MRSCRRAAWRTYQGPGRTGGRAAVQVAAAAARTYAAIESRTSSGRLCGPTAAGTGMSSMLPAAHPTYPAERKKTKLTEIGWGR